MSREATGGLILAGGKSRRMGFPKGAIRYHGVPQVDHLARVLTPFCAPVKTAVPQDSAAEPWLASHSLVFDLPGIEGPMSAVLAAFRSRESAWFVVAVDMPFLDTEAVGHLFSSREAVFDATAYRASDGGAEPLCCIYEPRLLHRIAAEAQCGERSLRDILHRARVKCVQPPAAQFTESVDTYARYISIKGEAR